MGLRIKHNVLALTARRNLWRQQNDLNLQTTKLSSGQRINNSWDDSAGLAVSEKFRAQIASMSEAERNANYGINLLATAEGALSVIDEKLIRMRSLAIEASNGTLTSLDRSYLDVEYQQLKSEITRIAEVTNYNGLDLLNGTYSEGAAGADGQGIKLHIGVENNAGEDYYYLHFTDMTSSGLGISASELTTTASAQNAIGSIDSAINVKDTERTRIGSFVTRLQKTVLNLEISQENFTQSESQIRDANMAVEMSGFVRAQILMQSGVSMLSQANQLPSIVANLFG